MGFITFWKQKKGIRYGQVVRRVGAALVAVLLCATCFVGLFTAEPAPEEIKKGAKLTGSEFLSVAKQGGLELFANPQNGDFYVENKDSGQKWYAYPPDRAKDQIATGFNQSNMESALIVKYINTKKVVNDTNSSISSVNKDGLSCYETEDGVLFEYQFPSEKFVIPVLCQLKDGSLDVSIVLDGIQENGDLKITECALMPYFGSASPSDTGYAVLPDGSGVLVPFDAKEPAKEQELYYRRPVYGRDLMLSLRADVTKKQEISLPVFGIKKQNSGVLGIITSGDAVSDIELYVKGNESEQMAVHPIMIYRNVDTTVLHEQQWNERTVTVYSQNPPSFGRYTVTYFLLGETDYSSMAKVAADYYMQFRDASVKRDNTTQLLLNLFCSVKKPDSLLGIPVDRLVASTDFEEAQTILKELSDSGVKGIGATAYGAFAGGLYDKMPTNAKLEGKLGGKKGWQALADFASQNGMALYPSADLINVYKSGSGVSYSGDASRSVHGGVMELSSYERSTYQPDQDGLKYTVLSAEHFEDVFAKFTKGLEKNKVSGILDIGVGHLSSDNHRNTFGKVVSIDRETAKLRYTAQIKELTAGGVKYMAETAGAYLLPYTSNISEVPYQSSRERGFGQDIPFYQLVAAEFAQLSAPAVNFSRNGEESILKAIEFGMAPSWFLSDHDTEKLHNSNANWMLSGTYAENKDTITAMAQKYGEALQIIASSPIRSHRVVEDQVVETTYASGARIYINYRDADVTINGNTVPAGGVLTVQG